MGLPAVQHVQAAPSLGVTVQLSAPLALRKPGVAQETLSRMLQVEKPHKYENCGTYCFCQNQISTATIARSPPFESAAWTQTALCREHHEDTPDGGYATAQYEAKASCLKYTQGQLRVNVPVATSSEQSTHLEGASISSLP